MRTELFVCGFHVSGIDLRDGSNFEDFCIRILPSNDVKSLDKVITEITSDYRKLGFSYIDVRSRDCFAFDSMELYSTHKMIKDIDGEIDV